MFSKQLYICQIINKPKPIIMEENNILIDKLNPYEIKDLKEVTSVKTSSRQKEKIVRKSFSPTVLNKILYLDVRRDIKTSVIYRLIILSLVRGQNFDTYLTSYFFSGKASNVQKYLIIIFSRSIKFLDKVVYSSEKNKVKNYARERRRDLYTLKSLENTSCSLRSVLLKDFRMPSTVIECIFNKKYFNLTKELSEKILVNVSAEDEPKILRILGSLMHEKVNTKVMAELFSVFYISLGYKKKWFLVFSPIFKIELLKHLYADQDYICYIALNDKYENVRKAYIYDIIRKSVLLEVSINDKSIENRNLAKKMLQEKILV